MSPVTWMLNLWYRASPYVYLVVGLLATMFSTSATGFASCALLVAMSVTILCLRRAYRSPEQQKLRKYARPVARRPR
jgi:hypothetical protein